MYRDKMYRRRMRRKHIRRKKEIAQSNFGSGWHYEFDGMYDKGKIHCSCPMCSQKTNNKGKNRLKHGNYYPSKNWKHSDKIQLDSGDDQLKEFEKALT